MERERKGNGKETTRKQHFGGFFLPVCLASLRFPFHSSRLSWFGPVLFVHLPSPLPPVVTNGMRNRGESKEPSVTSGMRNGREVWRGR